MTANITLQRSAYPGITSDNFLGSDCTGTNKTINRTLSVPNGISQVFVDRRILRPTDDYTVSGTTITFLIAVDNRHKITVFR